MSAQTYRKHLCTEATTLDLAIRQAEDEYDRAGISRRVELAGALAVLRHRRERMGAKLARLDSGHHSFLDDVRAEVDQDLTAFADFVERQIVGY